MTVASSDENTKMPKSELRTSFIKLSVALDESPNMPSHQTVHSASRCRFALIATATSVASCEDPMKILGFIFHPSEFAAVSEFRSLRFQSGEVARLPKTSRQPPSK